MAAAGLRTALQPVAATTTTTTITLVAIRAQAVAVMEMTATTASKRNASAEAIVAERMLAHLTGSVWLSLLNGSLRRHLENHLSDRNEHYDSYQQYHLRRNQIPLQQRAVTVAADGTGTERGGTENVNRACA